MLQISLFRESYHHAKRRQAANQHLAQSATLQSSLPSSGQMIINHSVLRRRTQSQSKTFGVIISCQNIDVFFFPPPCVSYSPILINHSRDPRGGSRAGITGSGGFRQSGDGWGLVKHVQLRRGFPKTTNRWQTGEVFQRVCEGERGQERSNFKSWGDLSYRHEPRWVVPVRKTLKHPETPFSDWHSYSSGGLETWGMAMPYIQKSFWVSLYAEFPKILHSKQTDVTVQPWSSEENLCFLLSVVNVLLMPVVVSRFNTYDGICVCELW